MRRSSCSEGVDIRAACCSDFDEPARIGFLCPHLADAHAMYVSRGGFRCMPQGTLFTEDFLNEGIRGTEAWRSITPEALAAFRKALQAIVKDVADPARLNEAQTEDRIVKPILESLGWDGCYWVQERLETKGRANVPDYLFFGTPEDFAQADRKAKGRRTLSARNRRRRCQGMDDRPRPPRLRRERRGNTVRPNSPLPLARRDPVRPQGAMGHPDQRPLLAALLPGRQIAARRIF